MIETLVGFARTLRYAGVAATPDRVSALLAAVAALDAADPAGVYWAGRLTLCGEPDDLPVYDAAFEAYFGGGRDRPALPRTLPISPTLPSVSVPFGAGGAGGAGDGEPTQIRQLAASPNEA